MTKQEKKTRQMERDYVADLLRYARRKRDKSVVRKLYEELKQLYAQYMKG